MKRVFTSFLALSSIALLMLSACKKDGNLVTATGGKPGALTATSTTLVLDKTKLTDPTAAISFSLTSPDYGYSAAVTNTLQIDAMGDNWANPITSTFGAKVLSASYSTASFNALLLKLNLVGGVSSQVLVRVSHSISANITPIYSNVLTLTVTPFNLQSFVYVPGAYQGWNPGSADSLLSPTSNGVFTGIIQFVGSDFGFKITTAKNWNNAYGDAGGGKVSTSGGNLTAPGDGAYQIVLDENANTIAFAYSQWSAIGDATPGGWGSDTDLKYNNGTGLWSGVMPLTSGGSIKFRFKHDWGINLGGSGGTLSLNGANIGITVSGNYLVVLDAVNDTYVLTKQ